MKRIRPRLTYANVVSSITLFLVLSGGAAIAANQLGKNTVGSKQLKKNAVTTSDIKKNAVNAAKLKKNAVTTAKLKKDAVTGAKVNEATLGTVPSSNLANALPPAEPVHLVGGPGEPPFESGSSGFPAEGGLGFRPVGFYKDQLGIVHLQGIAKPGPVAPRFIFTLPPGYRPTPGKLYATETLEQLTLIAGSGTSIEGISLDGKVLATAEETAVVLDGVSFRAES